ncbi:MAG: Na+/H+ antiporter NhaC [Crocinitomicaceae bacterium]|nr:Na+/H+ antiporter NhaC [Crocinitomicaceae bacterium]
MQKTPSLYIALIPIVLLIILLGTNVWLFGDNTLSGSNQITLLFSGAIAAVIGFIYGTRWEDMLNGAIKSISSAMGALIILLLIGSLAGTWMLSGIVPSMIYYGLEIINPKFFLFASCILCAIVSLATGSSWSTVATIGIAMLGIGNALGIHEGLTCGAIISGAYFGDKMSPLSDTTNLAPAMAGTDLITHIKYMTYTTVPSIVLALIAFLVIGLMSSPENNQMDQIDGMQNALINTYNISWMSLTVPILVIGMIVKKIPAIPALLIGTILGGLYAFIFQPELINHLNYTNNPSFLTYLKNTYTSVMNAMTVNVSVETGDKSLNTLIETDGMSGMLNTIWLIICAMSFGGIMEATGLLKKITSSLMVFVKSRKSLVLTTSSTCIFLNLTASDQYLAIVVPGRMFASSYKDYNLDPKNLSRTLEDSATVTSVLVPWNTCGATQAGVLGVATITYLPYCFLNLLSPVMTLIFSYASIKIAKLKSTDKSSN